MGGHGLIAWGNTSNECEQTSLELIERAEAFLLEHGRPDPLGQVRAGFSALEPVHRAAAAAALAPFIRGLASTDKPVVGNFFDDAVVLDFISREAAPELIALGTSCPDHFLRTKIRP